MHIPLLITPNTSYISIDEKSDIKMKLMLKIKNFLFRSQTNYIYHLQYIFRYISNQTSTSNSNYKRNRSFIHSSICICYSHPIPHISQSTKIIYEDEIDAEIQKLFKSLTDKWYISLIIYIMKHFKPNTEH